ncbi:hypothetical protein GO988_18470 [Hymenobacter sp. HMF4947]|uniref:STAS/SEC14 domain-containing protein n=1 Tax=Hymenobacter ginkgonis TaxID=2682976 RepID=A0A7K1TIT7_9BACT|nr:hypothetical protein [Hymenobacter ginkgonis]MVN78319.1 hypothetical protein [Hymenobacter ginkgonis]
MPAVLFTNPAGQLSADPAGFLRATWGSQPRSSQDVKALFEQILLQLQRQQWSRILVSQIGMQPFTPADQQWIAHDWLPRAVQGGYRHGAVVVSADVLVRLATAYITTHVQGLPLTYRSFDNPADAVRWLERQPKSAG